MGAIEVRAAIAEMPRPAFAIVGLKLRAIRRHAQCQLANPARRLTSQGAVRCGAGKC